MCEYGLLLERLGDAGVAVVPVGAGGAVLLSPGDTHRGAKDSAEPIDMLSLLFPLAGLFDMLILFAIRNPQSTGVFYFYTRSTVVYRVFYR
jgi:hypothetical protein